MRAWAGEGTAEDGQAELEKAQVYLVRHPLAPLHRLLGSKALPETQEGPSPSHSSTKPSSLYRPGLLLSLEE